MPIDNVLYPSFTDLSEAEQLEHVREATVALRDQMQQSLDALNTQLGAIGDNPENLAEFAEQELCNVHSAWYNNAKIGIKNDYPLCLHEGRRKYI